MIVVLLAWTLRSIIWPEDVKVINTDFFFASFTTHRRISITKSRMKPLHTHRDTCISFSPRYRPICREILP